MVKFFIAFCPYCTVLLFNKMEIDSAIDLIREPFAYVPVILSLDLTNLTLGYGDLFFIFIFFYLCRHTKMLNKRGDKPCMCYKHVTADLDAPPAPE